MPTPDPERTDLLAELTLARAALTGSVDGLTDEQLAERPTVSALCLGGLIKHVAATEHAWARFLDGDRSAMSFELPEGVTWADLYAGTAREIPQFAIDRQNEFTVLPGDTRAAVLARYEEVAAHTERVVAGLPDLSASYPLPEAPWNEPGAARSARRIVAHLIAETIQHAGHADIIRESIDGHTAMG